MKNTSIVLISVLRNAYPRLRLLQVDVDDVNFMTAAEWYADVELEVSNANYRILPVQAVSMAAYLAFPSELLAESILAKYPRLFSDEVEDLIKVARDLADTAQALEANLKWAVQEAAANNLTGACTALQAAHLAESAYRYASSTAGVAEQLLRLV